MGLAALALYICSMFICLLEFYRNPKNICFSLYHEYIYYILVTALTYITVSWTTLFLLRTPQIKLQELKEELKEQKKKWKH